MKYALFAYLHESWDDLPAEERRDLHVRIAPHMKSIALPLLRP
jgi:hypothetical protein